MNASLLLEKYALRTLKYPQFTASFLEVGSCFNEEMMVHVGAPEAQGADCSLGNYTCPPLSCFRHLFA